MKTGSVAENHWDFVRGDECASGSLRWRKRTPSLMLAVVTLASVSSTAAAAAAASSQSAAGGRNGDNSAIGESHRRARGTSTADSRLSQSLRDEAARLASGKQMLSDGLSVLGGAVDDSGVRRKTGEGYDEESGDAYDDALINGDDLALLDSIFGSSSAPSTSTSPEGVPVSEEIIAGEDGYDNYDPYDTYRGVADEGVSVDLVDDDEIDGLFERAGKLLEAEEVDGNLPECDFEEGGQHYAERGEEDFGRLTTEDMVIPEKDQFDEPWEDPNADQYEYDLYDAYLPGSAADAAFDTDGQWETGYSQQQSGEDGGHYDEFFEEELPAEGYDYVYDEQGQGGFQQQAEPYQDDEAEVLFDGDGGDYESEYDFTDPGLAMNGDEAVVDVVDEQRLHGGGSQRRRSQEEDSYKQSIDMYQQSSNLQHTSTARNYLDAVGDQDGEEFDSAFADASIAAARMEEEEEQEFEAEANDNTDNAADFDYIYEDRATLLVDDEDGFVTDGSPKHPHHPVPPVHAADSTIDGIIRAHRIAVAEDLGIETPLVGVFSSPSAATTSHATGAQQIRKQSDHPRSFGFGHSGGVHKSSPGFGGSGGGPFDDSDRNARMEAKRQKHERTFRRECAADVHKSLSTAVASVIRGDASPHVPANLFGQSLEEERAGCKLAGLCPEFDRNGMRKGKFCSEEELQTYVEWSSLLHSTYGDQCGAVDVATANAKLYGGAQYHRSIRCFSALLLTLPLPDITEEELSLLLTASGSAGSGSHGAAGHDGPDLLRTAAILCRTKMEGLVRFALDELAGRVEYILRDRTWECIKYSALVRPASEAGTGTTKYGSASGRKRPDVGDEAAYKYSELEEVFKKVAAEAYAKFVKKSVSEAAQLGWTDALALLRYVSWDLTMPKPKPKRKSTPSATSSFGPSSADIKPIRGGARGEAGSYYSIEETMSPEDVETSARMTHKAERYRAATVRPVKHSQRLKTRERRAKAAKEKAAKRKKEEKEANQGFFSKVRLFRRTKRDDDAPLDADVSAYYDLNELYGLDDEIDDFGERNREEDLGDLVGGVLSRGVVDDERSDYPSASSAAAESSFEGQLFSEVNEDSLTLTDGKYNLSRNQDMEDEDMLSILLRAAAVAASSNKGGMASSFETQTRAAMQALVKFVTDRWRRDLVSLIVGKFNSFCLLGFHSEFGAFLRREFEQKLVELEEEARSNQGRR